MSPSASNNKSASATTLHFWIALIAVSFSFFFWCFCAVVVIEKIHNNHYHAYWLTNSSGTGVRMAHHSHEIKGTACLCQCDNLRCPFQLTVHRFRYSMAGTVVIMNWYVHYTSHEFKVVMKFHFHEYLRGFLYGVENFVYEAIFAYGNCGSWSYSLREPIGCFMNYLDSSWRNLPHLWTSTASYSRQHIPIHSFLEWLWTAQCRHKHTM